MVAAGLVLTPSAPLGLLTNAVQTLAGVLLPSATVFLLLLCNDKAVLGPWVNTRWLNLFTGGVIAVLLTLSIILTASVMFPEAASEKVILAILGVGGILGFFVALGVLAGRKKGQPDRDPGSRKSRAAQQLAHAAARRIASTVPVDCGKDLDVCPARLSGARWRSRAGADRDSRYRSVLNHMREARANEVYLLQKMALFRVAGTSIADFG
ncbi:MAG: hypothetical protein WCC90_14120 [Methylocella sp.]